MATKAFDPVCRTCKSEPKNPSYAWCDVCIRKSPELQAACVALDSADPTRPATLREMFFGRKPRYRS